MNKPINLVLCWHMHQPYYRQGLDGDYQLPWVYLHGIKDYADMAAHLEAHPAMKTVVNFAPVLLEQLDDYAVQLKDYLAYGSAMHDPLLNYLAGTIPIPSDREGRRSLIANCRRAHAPRMIEPHPQFRDLNRLADKFPERRSQSVDALYLDYLDPQYFIDLLIWYHLAWMGNSLKHNPHIQELKEKKGFYSEADRRLLLGVIFEVLSGLIPRYRALADRGQVELSMTPYGHPIVPLLLDFEAMHQAQPEAPAPSHTGYPGGDERSRWHMQRGIKVFQHYFGRNPQGVWLSEGGVSDEAIALLESMDIQWSASGEAVWNNSHRAQVERQGDEHVHAQLEPRPLFKPYLLKDQKIRLFFRDDGLSDLIGFEYSDWHADDAVADLIHHIENIATSLGDEADKHVVSIILDGENAWEYYPDNGHFFLDGLYRALSESKTIRVKTFGEIDQQMEHGKFDSLVAGSWVYGTFSTWIGNADKNRAWDLLVESKRVFDEVMAGDSLDARSREQAERLMAICEGSDWFWWFGDDNAADSVRDFDQLFRLQLTQLYQLLGRAAPNTLEVPISHGGAGMENAGTMRRSS